MTATEEGGTHPTGCFLGLLSTERNDEKHRSATDIPYIVGYDFRESEPAKSQEAFPKSMTIYMEEVLLPSHWKQLSYQC